MKNNIENYRHETSDFKKSLNTCKTIYNLFGYAYIFIYGMTAAVSLVYGVVQLCFLNSNWIDIILDGIIFKAAAFVPAYLSIYKKENKYILFALLILIINILTVKLFSSLSGMVSEGIFTMTFIMSAVTLWANNKYHFLENQYGFPYFDELKTENFLDEISSNIKNEFKIASEQRRKTASDSMGDIVVTGGMISAHEKEKNNYMGDVSLTGDSSSDLTFKIDDNAGNTAENP
ncbi:MAG: hypothetical protein IJ666_07140 [Ruminococcus sp.]|nr:hypothetical protein [Ruminococcus sp.]